MVYFIIFSDIARSLAA
jgi:amino acid permease